MKNIYKYLTIVLCVVMVFVFTVEPIKASAVDPVTISVGALGAIAEVLPYVAVACFVLIACGYVVETLPQLIEDANLWLNSLPDFKEWALSVGHDLQEGTIIIIPEFVQEAMKKKAQENNKKVPDKIPYILLPPNFHQLDQATQEQLLNQQINTTLQQGNSILTQIKNTLTGFAGNVSQYFSNLGTQIATSMASLQSVFKAEFDQFKTWYKNINDNLKAEIHQIPNWLSNINTNMKNELGQVKTWLSNINENVKSDLKQIKNWLVDTRTSIVDGFKSLESKLESLLKPDGTNGGNGNNIGTDSGTIDPNIDGTVQNGINNGKVWFGNGKSFLGQYGSGFIVAGLIFNQFAEIPIINHLLIVSACIGLVSAFFGIAMMVNNNESMKQKKTKAKEG